MSDGTTGGAAAPTPVNQAQLFACTNHPEDRERLARAARDWAVRLPDSLRAEICVNDLSPDAAGLGEAFSTETSALPDVLVSLCGADESDIGDQFSQLTDSIAHLLSPASAVLGARCYRILEGDGPVRLFYAISRLPRLSREQFQHYWLYHHAELGRSLIPPYSYHQSHSDSGFTASLASATGLPGSAFDGVVAIHFPDLDACEKQLAREEVSALALEDEKNFIDHDRVLLGKYSVLSV